MTLVMEKYVTENNIEHGLVEEFSNAVQDHGYKHLSEKNRKELFEKKKKDLELVKVKYQHLQNQKDGKFEGPYCDYAGESIKLFRLLSNNVYVMPRGLARKINELGMPRRSEILDGSGMPTTKDGEVEKIHLVSKVEDF